MANRKIGEPEKREILAIVKGGGTVTDAADIIGVTRKTIHNAMKDDPEFYARVKNAKTAGKLRLVKKVRSAKPWQAAAWVLERAYGHEFGRKDVREIRQKRTVKHEHSFTIDYDQLAGELERLSRGIPENGRAKPVHPRLPNTSASEVSRLARS